MSSQPAAMLDFGALPPEINSGRMYSGPGSGPMLAAASAWDALATELASTAAGIGSVIAELTGRIWSGAASLSMANASAPYVTWLHHTSAQAEQTATQARIAATAYELAIAMTVPPPVIAANRSLLSALIATNFLGQNTPAIAATEAHYAEMWLQDAAAMYGYAESSAATTRLTPFSKPPMTQSAPLSSTAWLAIIEHVPNVTNSVLSTSNAVTSGRGIYAINERLAFQEARVATDIVELLRQPAPASPISSGRSATSAKLSRPGLVGKLSVPPGWTAAAPETRLAAPALPDSATPASASRAEAAATPGSVFSQSFSGTLSRHTRATPAQRSKPVIVRSPAAG